MDRDERKKGFPNLLRTRDTGQDPLPEARLLTVSEPRILGCGAEGLGEEAKERTGAASSPGNGIALSKSGPEMKATHDVFSSDASIDLSEEERKDIYEAIDVIRRRLSFVRNFTQEEKENLMRLGKSGRSFVEKAQDLVQRSPGILPRSFDPESFNRDADLYHELGDIADELKKLSEQVADIEAAIGSDAFTAALVVYQSGKLARTGDDMDNHLGGWRRKLNLE